MTLIASHVMQRPVHTVPPDMTLPDLEQQFSDHKVSGFPVVDEGRLVGVVSRSDIVQRLFIEHYTATTTSDFYRDESGFHEVPLETFEDIASRVGQSIESLSVKDVMVPDPIKVALDRPIVEVAQLLLEKRIHRVPVVEREKLVGIVSTVDLVRLIADGQLKPA
jgi:predicted transcriptional regulator